MKTLGIVESFVGAEEEDPLQFSKKKPVRVRTGENKTRVERKEKFWGTRFCSRCGVTPVVHTGRICEKCLGYAAEYRKVLLDQGLCLKCKVNPHRPNRTRCQECNDATVASNKKANVGYIEKFYELYGNACNCCGESERKFLNVDHVNNDAWIEKQEKGYRSNNISIMRRIMRSGIKDENFQILCFNCNCGKQLNNGVCPHKTTWTVLVGMNKLSQPKVA